MAVFRIQDGHSVSVGSSSYNDTAVMVNGLESEILPDVGHCMAAIFKIQDGYHLFV